MGDSHEKVNFKYNKELDFNTYSVVPSLDPDKLVRYCGT